MESAVGDLAEADGVDVEDVEAEGEEEEEEASACSDMVQASNPTVELRMSDGARLPRARLPPAP